VYCASTSRDEEIELAPGDLFRSHVDALKPLIDDKLIQVWRCIRNFHITSTLSPGTTLGTLGSAKELAMNGETPVACGFCWILAQIGRQTGSIDLCRE
jgi:hypothetical protein